MDIKRIEALMALMKEGGLSHLELREGEDQLILSRAAPTAALAPQAAAPPAALPAEPPPAAEEAEQEGEALTSPLVGCVYLAPGPGQSPFVRQGDAVKKGQVLCIVEAMKVMNEFLAPRDGVVAKVCVEDGQLAEYGQTLFCLK